MNSRRTQLRPGFTLLELLVAIVVLGVVTTLGTQAFFGLTTAWQDTRKLAALDHHTELMFAGMRRDFDRALSSELTGLPLRGTYENRPDDPRFWDQELAADRIVFAVESPSGAGGEVEPRLVTYSIDPVEDALLRAEGPLSGDSAPNTGGGSVIRGARVLRFRAEYMDGKGQWQREWLEHQWTGGSLPRAVRVSVTLADESRREIQVARKEVFAVRVR